jgi:hypothetical protein
MIALLERASDGADRKREGGREGGRERKIVEFESGGEVHFRMDAKLENERARRGAGRKKTMPEI